MFLLPPVSFCPDQPHDEYCLCLYSTLKDNVMKPKILRVPDQNGVSLLYIMFEIHHSGQEPSICN